MSQNGQKPTSRATSLTKILKPKTKIFPSLQGWRLVESF